jgi:hypothetical protein
MRFILLFVFVFLVCPAGYSQRILVIGDSHTVGPFGYFLQHKLVNSKKFKDVVMVGSWGSSAYHYLTGGPNKQPVVKRENRLSENLTSTPVFSELLEIVKPDQIVISLGANDVLTQWETKLENNFECPANDKACMFGKKLVFSYAQRAKLIELLQAYGKPCLWVTPPDAPEYFAPESFLAAMEDLEEQVVMSQVCSILAVRDEVILPPGGDHLHFNYYDIASRRAANRFANKVMNRISKL